MTQWRQLILGILLGGLLLSGGWFAWGSVSQEVGIHFLDSGTGGWIRATGSPPGSADGEGIYVLPGGGFMPVGSDVASEIDNVATNNGSMLARTLTYEFNGTGWDRVRTYFKQTTSGITTNAAGSTLFMGTTPMNDHSIQVDRTAGATDVVDIRFECQLESPSWTSIFTISTLASEPVMNQSRIVRPCMNVRYNVVTVGAGNTLAIHILSMR
jgi:hypothetical protein